MSKHVIFQVSVLTFIQYSTRTTIFASTKPSALPEKNHKKGIVGKLMKYIGSECFADLSVTMFSQYYVDEKFNLFLICYCMLVVNKDNF